METTIATSLLEAASGQTIWCLMFVCLWLWTSWENKKREDKAEKQAEKRESELTEIIKKYGDNFKEITEILVKLKEDVQTVKVDVEILKNKGGEH